MPNQQLKKEMVERGKGKIAKLIGRIAIYNDSKKADLCIANIPFVKSTFSIVVFLLSD